ncbi:MAG TPA: N-acetylglucosamine-6-phosphate deacetylase [Clostridia bacterium]|nr:N-acetylglucosamine-6-phosphate deacetylase [Clostridia bacterium]
MRAFYLKNGLVYQEGRWSRLSITVDRGVIQALGQANETGLGEVDAGGAFILPGYIDPHCHGGQGIDCNRASCQDFLDLSFHLAQKGVTAWLASLAPDSKEGTLRALDQAAQAIESQQGGAQLCGIHLEGPFLSPRYRASLDASFLKAVDFELLDDYMKASRGHIRSMTLAPELPGALDLIDRCRSWGIAVALGHSDASYEETIRAWERGASCVTHLANAMPPLHHRRPGILGAALDSDLYTEIICDGIHLHPAFVRLVAKIKGSGRLIAVTDAMMAAGLEDGDYSLAGQAVRVKEGQPRLADGRLAGSTLSMDQALKNLMTFTGKSLGELMPAFSANAASFLGLEDKKGQLAPGYDADLLILGPDYRLGQVFCRGQMIY